MMTVERERATYDAMWQRVPQYRDVSPGVQHIAKFLEMSGATGGTVLDAGCGTGAAGLLLADRGFRVTLCDVTDAGIDPAAADRLPFVRTCLWHDLSTVSYLATVHYRQHGTRFDYVYNGDVMEHIPTEYVMLTLDRMLAVTGVGAFFSIALVADVMGLWIGSPLHHTIKPFTWWRDRLGEVGTVAEARDCLNHGLYWVTR